MKKILKFSICIPTYNGASLIGETLKSILSQDFQNYEIIISDDNSTDNTLEVIKGFKDARIKVFKNKENLGCGRNLEVLRKLAKGDVLFLMGQDDILLKAALSKTYNAFLLGEEIGMVTRPYYWFDEDVRKPVRAVKPYDKNKDSVISVFDGKREVEKIFESVGQLSGLACRRRYMDIGFHEEIFPTHIYPLASILKRYKAVYLKDYTVAVRIGSSMCRHKPDIYVISPTKSWIKMFETVYDGDKYESVRKQGIDFTARNFAGLVQLKNYASLKILLREIFILIKYRWRNIFDTRFWLFSLGTILIPRRILIKLVDNFKREVLSKTLKDITIEI